MKKPVASETDTGLAELINSIKAIDNHAHPNSTGPDNQGWGWENHQAES